MDRLLMGPHAASSMWGRVARIYQARIYQRDSPTQKRQRRKSRPGVRDETAALGV